MIKREFEKLIVKHYGNFNNIPIEISPFLTDLKELFVEEHDTEGIKKENDLYARAINAMNDGIWDWNLQTNQLYLSRRWKEMLGFSDTELANEYKTFESLLYQDDKERVLDDIRNFVNGNNERFAIQFRMRHKNGSLIWISAKAEALRNEDGETYRMIGSHSDITEKMRTDLQLVREIELQNILMQIATKYINISLDEVENIVSKTLGDLAKFVKADRAYIFDYDWEKNDCSNTYEWCEEGITPEIDNLQNVPLDYIPHWVNTHKSGGTMYIDDVFALDENDGVRMILEPQGVKSLITIPIMDGDACIGFLGFDSVRDYYRYTEREKTLLHLFAQMLVNVGNRRKADLELRKYSHELEEKNISLKNALQKAEAASQAKSEFLANMSHEIRTPMNSILGFSEVMMNTTTDFKQKGYLKTILDSGKTLLSLINDILDLSKIEAGRLEVSPEATDLREIIREISLLFQQKIDEKNLNLIIEICEDFPKTVVIDEVRLRQILLNLVGNAVKFTEKGFIKIAVSLLKDKNGVTDFEIAVLDSGVGISDEFKERIFDSFAQEQSNDSRKYEGTGLGLAISKRLCELMNGKISVFSKRGEGSKFVLTFNNVKYSDEINEDEALYVWNEEEIIFNGSKILIVDDVFHNRELVSTYLSQYNLTVYHAENGEIALNMVKEYKPDLVFMDIRMPGMNGYDATKLIREEPELKSIPIIALTASTMQTDHDRIMSLFDGYLRKPVHKKSLINEMTKYLPFERVELLKPDELSETGQIDNDTNNNSISDEIKKLFNDLFLEKIKSQDGFIIINELTALKDELLEFAEKHHVSILRSKLVELGQSLELFDFEKIQENLSEIINLFN